MAEKNTEYSYSIERVEFALLNHDKTVPFFRTWTDKHPVTGKKREHKGCLFSKKEPFNLKSAGSSFNLGFYFGTERGKVSVISTAADETACTAEEMAADLNTALSGHIGNYIIEAVDGRVVIRDNEDPALQKPFYMPFGFEGLLANLLGITGWVATKEAKNFKDDPEKEQGKSVDATSGRGVRCSIKDPDTIKGLNITVNLAGMENRLIAMLTGNTYNEETDEYYMDNKGDAPVFAARYYCRQFSEGSHTKSSNDKMRIFVFPSCQLTLSGSEAGEGTISSVELSGSAGENTASNLPMKFHKGISMADYMEFVESDS